MKFLIVAAALLVVVSARTVRIADLGDCSKDAGAIIRFSGSVETDPTPVPGNMTVQLALEILGSTNESLVFQRVTVRLSDGYRVPCLDGIHGSCTVNLCEGIAQYPDYFCRFFPPELPCQCPLAIGNYDKVTALVEYDEAWLDLPGGPSGDYASRVEIIEDGFIKGCADIEFTLQ